MVKKKQISKNNKLITSEYNETTTSTLHILVNEKLEYLQDIIINTILSIQSYKKLDIFSNSDSILSVSLLNELFDKCIELLNVNSNYLGGNITSGNVPQSILDSIINDLQKIIDKLATIFMNFGTHNLEDLIFICFGNEYKNMKQADSILQDKYNLLKKYVHPIGYKMITWKTSGVQPKKHLNLYGTNINHVNCYCEDKITDDTICYESSYHLECYDVDQTISKTFYNKINGIRLILQNEKNHKTLIINCIVDPIGIELLYGLYVKSRRNDLLNGIPDNLTDDTNLIQRIIDSMLLKDILICGNNDLYKKIYTIYTEVNSIKQNKLDIVIKKFLDTPISSQRNTLINLLIYNKEENIQYITYLLYDLISLNIDQNNNDSNEQKIIYESFPWRIKMYFKDTMKLAIKYTQDMLSKYDINKISLEQQIFLLKAPENVKEKAMIKLKEIKGKGDEQAIKAKQYLEGLIKIPFGIYKKEPLLNINNSNNDLYQNLLHKYNNDISNSINISKKDKYTCIEINSGINEIEKDIKKNFISDLIYCLDNCSLKQLNSCISFIKTFNFIDIERFGVIGTNKNDKCELLKQICNYYFQQNNSCFYKLYEIIENDNDNGNNKYKKFYNDIKEIQDNISNIHKSIDSVNKVLDDSIYGHNHAKNQIMKIICQWMTGEQNGYCFGFEGSPGIGKTSLAKKGLSHCLIDEYGKERPFSFNFAGINSSLNIFETFKIKFPSELLKVQQNFSKQIKPKPSAVKMLNQNSWI
jgi:hypothetical protein